MSRSLTSRSASPWKGLRRLWLGHAGSNLLGAVEGAVHKLEQQLRRHKEKLIGSHRNSQKASEATKRNSDLRPIQRRRIRSRFQRFRSTVTTGRRGTGNEVRGLYLPGGNYCQLGSGGQRDGDRRTRRALSCPPGSIADEDKQSIIQAVLKREELGSTGIGRGIAVPHTKHPNVKQLVGTVGLSEDGIDFNSLDGEKVQLFFLLVSPPDKPGDHLRALENISRQLREDTFCRFLKQSKSTADIVQLLEEADNNQFVS